MKTRLIAGAAALLLVSGFAAPAAAPLNRAEWADRARAELLHSWRAYERHAWGSDELKPVSRTAHNWHRESLLMTPVDTLDTLLLMGLTEEADKVKALIVEKLSFDKNFEVKNFEITIRLLGGLRGTREASAPRRGRLAPIS
jgi:mannosidase alpha-like ER degradation enhancer 2